MAGVRHCLSEKVNSIERIRRFAKRARQYLLAYHAIDSGQVSAEVQQECSKYGPVALEKLLREFRTHRCVMDFDFKFVMNPDQKRRSISVCVAFVCFLRQNENVEYYDLRGATSCTQNMHPAICVRLVAQYYRTSTWYKYEYCRTGL